MMTPEQREADRQWHMKKQGDFLVKTLGEKIAAILEAHRKAGDATMVVDLLFALGTLAGEASALSGVATALKELEAERAGLGEG